MPISEFGAVGWISLICAIYLFIHGVCTVNLMSKRTPWMQSVGYSLFTVGVFGVLLSALFKVPVEDEALALVFSGLALYYAYRSGRIWRANMRRLHKRNKAQATQP